MNEYDEKIELLKGEILTLQGKVNELKYKLNELSRSIKENNKVNENQVTGTSIFNVVKKEEVLEKKQDVVIPTEVKTYDTVNKAQNSEPPKKDFEKIVGKKFMGICASALICISLFLFAKAIYPLIGDMMRIIIMYAISFTFLITGVSRLKKVRNSVFNVSLTACGLGAIYISLLLTNIYFKVIGDITLYILIMMWAIFTCYLSRLKENVFHIIGELGITIAMIFGAILVSSEGDIQKIFMLLIFMIVGTISFTMFSKKNSASKDIIINIFNIINISIMLGLVSDYETNLAVCIPAGIIMSLFVLFYILSNFYKVDVNNLKDCSFSIINIFYLGELFLSISLITNAYGSKTIAESIFIILTTLLLILNEIKFKSVNSINKIICQIFGIILIMSLGANEFWISKGIIATYSIIFILYGFVSKNGIYKYAGLFYLLRSITGIEMNTPLYIIMNSLIFAFIGYNVITKKNQYSELFKIISYILLNIFLLITITEKINLNFEYEINCLIQFGTLSIINIIAVALGIRKSLVTNEAEQGSTVVINLIIALFMIIGLQFISEAEIAFCKFIFIAITLALFMINSLNLLNRYKESLWPGIYVGIKLTVLLIVILSSFSTEGMIMSIACIIFAILAITIGFALKYKSVRVYGLILSLISIAKLILIDIQHNTTIGYAIGVFACGIACFGVSLMYNMLDKRIGK